MTIKQIISAGGIVFNEQGQILIGKHNSPDGRWQLPKGHVEEGQTVEEAALREVEEETGITAKIIDKVGDSEYFVTYKDQQHPKKVIFFLMEYVSGDTKQHDAELSDVGWYAPQAAANLINHTDQKELLQKAMEMRHHG